MDIFYTYSLFRKKIIKEENNPYIKSQKLIDENNRDYEEYLKWMSEHSYGVPLQKVKSKEEFEAETRLKKLLDKM